jgi:hypothetical protein
LRMERARLRTRFRRCRREWFRRRYPGSPRGSNPYTVSPDPPPHPHYSYQGRERERERGDCLKCFGGYLSRILTPGEVFGWAYSPRRGPASPGANSRNSQRLVSYRAATGGTRLITCGDRENPDIPWRVGYQGGWRCWRLGGGGPAGQDTLGVARSAGTNSVGVGRGTSGTDTLAERGGAWLWMAGISPQQLGARTPLAYLLSRTACAPGVRSRLITCREVT